MATISTTNELDVLEKYESLVKESLGSESVYIRTKETLDELFQDNTITSADKAKIISNVLANLNTALVNGAMSTALQWADKEKDVELRKLELAKQLDILDNEILLSKNQQDKVLHESVNVQAQTRRLYGIPTVIDGQLTALTDTGKTFEETEVLKQQYINLTKEANVIDGKVKESQAAVHKIVADTYVNYGDYTYTLAENGLTAITTGTGYNNSLSSIQKTIAQEQAKGYAYNAWANALTGSASLLGTAYAAGTTTDLGTYITNVQNIADKFAVVAPPTF